MAAACPVFPADSFWHADVRSLPVAARSDAWIAAMGGTDRRLHPDFGPSDDPDSPYGIPTAEVGADHPTTSVRFEYADESDPGPYPFGPDIPVEAGSDRHAIVIDRDRCVLFELYAADWNGGSPTAGSGAVFDLRSNGLRPAGWTSADAAGLAIYPGLLRLDEVRAGSVDHVVRITAQQTDRSFVWPARHQAGARRDPGLPPMGAWFRMKAGYDTSRLRPATRVILEAFKTHGLIVADNGSNWFVTGAADKGWDPAVLDELKAIPARAFEAVDTSPLMADPNSGRVAGAPAPATTLAPTTSTSSTSTSSTSSTTTAAPASATSTSSSTTSTTFGRDEAAIRASSRPNRSRWWVPLAALAVAAAVAISIRGRRRRRRR